MTSPTTSRREGLIGEVAYKAPVTVLADSNITLSGEQTIDGKALLAVNAAGVPDRVLCTAQTDATQNGIYDVSTAAWTRSPDANNNTSFKKGTTVLVASGDTYAGNYWKIDTADPITIGSTSISWSLALASSLSTLSFLQAGANAVSRGAQDKMREGVSLDDFFLAGMADDTLALQRAITAVGSGGVINLNRNASISGAVYAVQITAQNVTIAGGKKKSTLSYSGAGVAIQLGSDNGLPWDGAYYNGPAQGFKLKDVDLRCTNDGTAGKPLTALLNSITGQSYGTGTYGIQDWRGGSTRLENAAIYNFEYGYWGVQGDINCFYDVTIGYNHVGIYLGPRCDQGHYSHIWTFGNDTAWLLEGARHTRIEHWASDTDGSGTTAPAIVRNSSPARNARFSVTRTQANNVFHQPWLEQLGTFGGANPGYDVPHVFELGVDDATLSGGVAIRDPFVVTYIYSDATKPHFLFLAKVGNVATVEVGACSGAPGAVPWNNMRAVFNVDVGPATPARMWFSDADNLFGSRLIENYNASSAVIQIRSSGFGLTYLSNVVGGTGAVLIGGLGLHRLLTHNNAPPAAGNGGDIVLNRTFALGKSLGWAYDGGSAHVIHVPMLGANQGDADVTLTPETDVEEQSFGTLLTADRTVILDAPPATAKGHMFAITRYATGAFNLNVRNLTGGGTLLKAMPASSWAVFMWNGATWLLRRYGTL